MIAEIISTGTELLLGKVANTNAAWLASRLSSIGVIVKRITVIGDELNEIIQVITEALSRDVDLLITTGGLGPTDDDMTMLAISKAIKRDLVKSKKVIQDWYKRYGDDLLKRLPIIEKMAWVPKGSLILLNPIGMAPGIIVKYKKSFIIALPGVPKEMMAIYNKYVHSFILRLLHKSFLVEGNLTVRELPEALVNKIVRECIDRNLISEGKLYVKTRVLGMGKVDIILISRTETLNRNKIEELLNNIKKELMKQGAYVGEIRVKELKI